eukprot:g2294.t1
MIYCPGGLKKKVTLNECVVLLLKTFNLCVSIRSLKEMFGLEDTKRSRISYETFFDSFSRKKFKQWRKKEREAEEKLEASDTFHANVSSTRSAGDEVKVAISPRTMKRTVKRAFTMSGGDQNFRTTSLDYKLQTQDKKRVEIHKMQEKKRIETYADESAHFASKLFGVAEARRVISREMGRHFSTVQEAFLEMDSDHSTSALSLADFRKGLRNRFNLEMTSSDFIALVNSYSLVEWGSKAIAYEAFSDAFGSFIDGERTSASGLDYKLQVQDKKRVEIHKTREKKRIETYADESAHFASKLFGVAEARRVISREMGRHFSTVQEAFLEMDSDHSTSTLSLADFRKGLRNRFNLEMTSSDFIALVNSYSLVEWGSKAIAYEAFSDAFGSFIDGERTSASGLDYKLQTRDKKRVEIHRIEEKKRIETYADASKHFDTSKLFSALDAQHILSREMGRHYSTCRSTATSRGGGISIEMQNHDAMKLQKHREDEKKRIAKYKRASAHFTTNLMTAEEARDNLMTNMRRHFRSLHEAYLAMAVDRTKKFLTARCFRKQIRNIFEIEMSNAEFKRLLKEESLVELGTTVIRYRAFRNAFASVVDGPMAGDLLGYGAEKKAETDRMLKRALQIAKSPKDLCAVRLEISKRSPSPVSAVSPLYAKRKSGVRTSVTSRYPALAAFGVLKPLNHRG